MIPVPDEKADDLKGLFMEMGSEKNMEFDMLDETKDLKEVSSLSFVFTDLIEHWIELS